MLLANLLDGFEIPLGREPESLGALNWLDHESANVRISFDDKFQLFKIIVVKKGEVILILGSYIQMNPRVISAGPCSMCLSPNVVSSEKHFGHIWLYFFDFITPSSGKLDASFACL